MTGIVYSRYTPGMKHRKTASKSHRFTKKHLPVWLVVIGVAIVVVGLGFGYLRTTAQPTCANSKTCVSDETELIENGAVGFFQGQRVNAPTINPLAEGKSPKVLGTNNPSLPKHIYVDLSLQKLYAYEGENKIFETWVATGRWGKTPTGNFTIWTKLRSTRMSGGSGSDAYDLPNVPFVMYFYHDFGLHGAYWHDNFGHTMSHGCVNLRQIDAETLFNWADGPTKDAPGTAVSICDRFTGPNQCEQDNPIKL